MSAYDIGQFRQSLVSCELIWSLVGISCPIVINVKDSLYLTYPVPISGKDKKTHSRTSSCDDIIMIK